MLHTMLTLIQSGAENTQAAMAYPALSVRSRATCLLQVDWDAQTIGAIRAADDLKFCDA